MMEEFYLVFWELQEVWNQRLVSVKTDKNPLKLTIDDINHQDFDIEWLDLLSSDYGDVIKIDDIQIVNAAGNPYAELMDKYGEEE
jgi:predicted membrane protein